MNKELLPEVDEKYLDFQVGELLVLKPEWDDNDYKRIYKVVEVESDTITVEVTAENPINKGKYQKVESGDISSVGRQFTIESEFFTPYM